MFNTSWIVRIDALSADSITATTAGDGKNVYIDNVYVLELEAWLSSENRWGALTNLSPALRAEKREAIIRDGFWFAVTIDRATGQILDGHEVLEILCEPRLSGKTVPFKGSFHQLRFEDEASALDYQTKLALEIRVPNKTDRHRLIAEVIKRRVDWADSRIAHFIGMSGKTVTTVSEKLESEGLNRPSLRLCLDGIYRDITEIGLGKKLPKAKTFDTIAMEAWRVKHGCFAMTLPDVIDLLTELDIPSPGVGDNGFEVGSWDPVIVERWILALCDSQPVKGSRIVHCRLQGVSIYQLVPASIHKNCVIPTRMRPHGITEAQLISLWENGTLSDLPRSAGEAEHIISNTRISFDPGPAEKNPVPL